MVRYKLIDYAHCVILLLTKKFGCHGNTFKKITFPYNIRCKPDIAVAYVTEVKHFMMTDLSTS